MGKLHIGHVDHRPNQPSRSLVLAAPWIVVMVAASLTAATAAPGDDAPSDGQGTTAAGDKNPSLADNSLPFVFLNPWGEDAGSIGEVFRKDTLPYIDVKGLLVVRSLCDEIRPNDVIVGIDKVKITNKGNAKRGVEKAGRMTGTVDLTLFRLDGLEWRQQVVRCPLIARTEFHGRLEADEKQRAAARAAVENRTFVDKTGQPWTVAEIERHNDPILAALKRKKAEFKDQPSLGDDDERSIGEKLATGDGVLGSVMYFAKNGVRARYRVGNTIYGGLSGYMHVVGQSPVWIADVELLLRLTTVEGVLVGCCDGRLRTMGEIWNDAVLNKGYSPRE